MIDHAHPPPPWLPVHITIAVDPRTGQEVIATTARGPGCAQPTPAEQVAQDMIAAATTSEAGQLAAVQYTGADYLQPEPHALATFARRLLDPEGLGHLVDPVVRREAQVALGAWPGYGRPCAELGVCQSAECMGHVATCPRGRGPSSRGTCTPAQGASA